MLSLGVDNKLDAGGREGWPEGLGDEQDPQVPSRRAVGREVPAEDEPGQDPGAGHGKAGHGGVQLREAAAEEAQHLRAGGDTRSPLRLYLLLRRPGAPLPPRGAADVPPPAVSNEGFGASSLPLQ